MSLTDPIADAITKIRNAYLANHKAVTVNHSNINESILKILAPADSMMTRAAERP